jgi:hypothetical protein
MHANENEKKRPNPYSEVKFLKNKLRGTFKKLINKIK